MNAPVRESTEVSFDAEETPRRILNAAALQHLDVWVPKLKSLGLDLTFDPAGAQSPINFIEQVTSWGLSYSSRWLAMQLGLRKTEGYDKDELAAITAKHRPADAEPEFDAARVGPTPESLTVVPGLLGRMTDWIVGTARQPNRVLALGAAIGALGTLMGGRISGPTRSGTHLYIITLAPTAVGKDHGLKMAARLLTMANAAAKIGPGSFMSGTAVTHTLETTPTCLCCIDEAGAFLAKVSNSRASTHEQAISGFLRQAWGSSFTTMPLPRWANGTMHEARNPAMGIYGASTPGEFFQALKAKDVDNGFINRWLLIESAVYVRDREPDIDKFADPPELREDLLRFHAAANQNTAADVAHPMRDGPSIVMGWADADAKAAHERLLDTVEPMRMDAALSAYYARTTEMAVRLATIRAAGVDIAGGITVADMVWGSEVALLSARQMVEAAASHMADSAHHELCNSIVAFLKARRGWVPHWEIAKNRRGPKAKELADALESLCDQRRVESRSGERVGSGRPSLRLQYKASKGQ